jgi:RsiW-degrading membrane proteinase PrsW (M82 family)
MITNSAVNVQVEKSASDVGRRAWAPHWWLVFPIGLVLWTATVADAFYTNNLILLPTVVLLGSFLVPVTGVVSAFILAGVLGALAASVLEFWLVYGPGLFGYLKVGLIEELVKGVLIVLFALGLRSYTTRDGMVLGATVGFGFAALESSGYALASLFVVQGQQLFLSLPSVVLNELVRGLLAPFGHGLWSAILGGVIFHVARNGRLRPSLAILITYVGVALLHAAFDAFGGIAGYIVISIIGIAPLVYLWLRGDRGLPFRRQNKAAGSAGIVSKG